MIYNLGFLVLCKEEIMISVVHALSIHRVYFNYARSSH